MAINAEWKRRKTEEDKKIVKITTLDPQKDKRKVNESQRRWIKKGNESGWIYSMRICTCNPYLEIAVKTNNSAWKRDHLLLPHAMCERDEDLFYINNPMKVKRDGPPYAIFNGKKNFWKKKKRVQSAIALIVVFWPDEASLCGMVAEECWPGASFWRRDGAVDDSSFSFFKMFSTISSINSDSGLQLEV